MIHYKHKHNGWHKIKRPLYEALVSSGLVYCMIVVFLHGFKSFLCNS